MLAMTVLRLAGRKHGIEYVVCTEKKTEVLVTDSDLAFRLDAAKWHLSSSGKLAGPGGYGGMSELGRALGAAMRVPLSGEDVACGKCR